MEVNDKLAWNSVTSSSRSFLQSWEWGELQKKLGKKVFRLNVSGLFASVIEQKLPLGQAYFYVPHGPVLKDAQPDSLLNLPSEIASAAGSRKAVFLRIEPLDDGFRGEPLVKALKKAGFRGTEPVQPRATLVVDLTKSEGEILGEMEHDTRYAIRAAEKRGVKTRFYSGNEKENVFELFWQIFSETNAKHGLKTYSKDYYKKVAELDGSTHSTSSGWADSPRGEECFSKIAVAELDDVPISAAMFVYFGKRAFYLFAGSKSGYGKFNAPTYLLWRAMQEAKNSGYFYFDFWGISHDNEKWAKITAFKKSFGGKETVSVGAWDYVYSKPRYLIYNLAKLIKRL